MAWVVAHGGRITGDELAVITALGLPLLLLMGRGLSRVLSGAHVRPPARGEDRDRG